jgi:hypothetical protein
LSDTYEAILKIDNEEADRSNIVVAAGDTLEVTFTFVVEKSGRFSVDIEGLRGLFFVRTPPLFETSELTVFPAEVVRGEEVQISMIISNRGELTGTHRIILFLNDEIIGGRDITLDGGSSQRVVFTAIADQTGTCAFSVADNEFRIEVSEPVLSEESEIEGAVAELPLEEVRDSQSEDESETGNGNWRLWAIFSGMGILVIVLLILLKIISKKSS